MMHIAFSLDDQFLPWCATAVRSLFDQNDPVALTVHLLHGTNDVHVGDLAHMVEQEGATAILHAIEPSAIGDLPVSGRFGSAVWYRLLLPRLLPSLARVLYLDSDLLVAGSLESLWNADLDGKPIGAVANVVQPSHVPRLRAMGVEDTRRFFNSGVLLLDLDRMRAENVTARVIEAVHQHAGNLAWADQEPLNLVLRDQWHPLHPRWNAQTAFWESPDLAADVLGAETASSARDDPAIVHFEGPPVCKPWHTVCVHPWRERWWATLRRTPWAAAEPADRTAATTLISRLPQPWRLPAYARLVGWRERSTGTLRHVAGRAWRKLHRGLTRRWSRHRRGSTFDIVGTLDDAVARDIERCRPYTLTSPERLVATMDAVEYAVRGGVPGALVECGVWKGGNVLAMLVTLRRLGVDDRDIWLYDTFEGMTEPTEHDTSDFQAPAGEAWAAAQAEDRRVWGQWFDADVFGVDQVRELLLGTGYPEDRLHFVVGPVEATIPGEAPEQVAVLRLDTDWYESTRHELVHLYPRLSPRGVLVVDDYGHWKGARRAVDEYLSEQAETLLLHRSDYTGRVAVKPG